MAGAATGRTPIVRLHPNSEGLVVGADLAGTAHRLFIGDARGWRVVRVAG
ncbi:hypothetical protein [Conexibacter sp. SYSU D00693]|nr:hypothetical protein [Conexibacter sp. SYSU D00693]